MQDAKKEIEQQCYRMEELARTCGEDIKALWKETDNCAVKEKVRIRMNASIKYGKDIQEALGDDWGHCIFFANAFSNMSVECYLNEIWTPCENWSSMQKTTDNIWLQCLNLIWKDNKAVTTYEDEKVNNLEKVSERCNKKIDSDILRDLYYQETGMELEEDPNDIYSANGSYTRYSRLCFCFEFMFCWILYNKIDTNLPLFDRVCMLKSKLELGCLCIALTIEKRKLRILDNFSKRDFSDVEATEAELEAKEVELPTELNTERAREYFPKAIAAGFMERTENGYHWTFGGNRGKVRLGYFLVKVYCPKNKGQLPLKAVGKLFNVERLDSAINRFNGTNKDQKWIPQIDELFED